MAETCLIVGGGLMGMLSARELHDAGVAVRVLERGAAGGESSWAGGGILSPLYPWRFPDPVTALALWGQEYYPKLSADLLAETGIDSEWTPSGLLILDLEERDAAEAWARRLGLRLEVVDKAGMRRAEPSLVDVADEALWLPDVAQIRNPRLVKALKASLELRGVPVEENVDVSTIVQRDGRVAGVETAAGFIGADRVLVAGGAWSAELLKSVGINLPVRPVRGQMILFHARRDLVHCVVLYRDRYLIPRRDGRILAGSTLEETGFDKSTTEDARGELYRAAVQLVPDLADFEVERHWAGLRPGSPEGIPYIAEHPTIAGLWVNAGHYRNGVVLGAASARLLADLMLARTPILDPAPYAIE